ncbi:hypothetical protein KTT_05610 [Tengunoibacter tsumagoiensis]|uniref:Uncharacterized protein n=1 Tax=Tengunoibacter tsumagoiensis TaxID=2014871 RepID=A0A401ZV74_9CHLR|nr:hypothetical protein KTT_05610 [Tengunoibacter tsumagoiensis]
MFGMWDCDLFTMIVTVRMFHVKRCIGVDERTGQYAPDRVNAECATTIDRPISFLV